MGKITFGKGDVKVLTWRDQDPVPGIKHIGFGSWSTPLLVKNIKLSLPLTSDRQLEKRFDPLKHLGTWHDSQTFSDVILKTPKGISYYAHKVVLYCCGGAYFEQLVSEEAKERDRHGKDIYTIDDILEECISIILEYIYTGYLDSERLKGMDIESISNLLQIDGLLETFNSPLPASSLDSAKSLHLRDNVSNDSLRPKRKKRLRFDPLFLDSMFSDITCETTFISDDGEYFHDTFPCHRLVLSILSEPFLLMFLSPMKEASEKKIQLQETPFIFELALEYIYTEKIESIETLSMEDMVSILRFSDRFAIFSLRLYIAENMVKCLTVDNAYFVLSEATFFSIPYLYHHTLKYIIENFDEIIKTEHFLDFDSTSLTNIIFDDNLEIRSEIELYKALMTWGTTSNCNDRTEDLIRLLSYVRYPLFTLEQLQTLLEDNELVRQTPHLHDAVVSAIEELDPLKRRTNLGPSKVHTTLRRPMASQLMFSHVGDDNGALYWIATLGGAERWQNPHRTGRIKIICSSPSSRWTKPEAVVNRSCTTVNYASGSQDYPAWWLVDLGEKYQLLCNYYTFQTDGAKNTTKDWSFQASNDKLTWTTIKEHENETTTAMKGGSYFGWKVETDLQVEKGYRYFRVIVTGNSVKAPHKFSLCGLELYGFLSTDRKSVV